MTAHDPKDGWKPLTNVADWPDVREIEIITTAYGPAVRLSDIPHDVDLGEWIDRIIEKYDLTDPAWDDSE